MIIQPKELWLPSGITCQPKVGNRNPLPPCSTLSQLLIVNHAPPNARAYAPGRSDRERSNNSNPRLRPNPSSPFPVRQDRGKGKVRGKRANDIHEKVGEPFTLPGSGGQDGSATHSRKYFP